jgi:hypothetical protein
MLSTVQQLSSQQINTTSLNKDTSLLLGDLGVARDGSWYRYTYNGGTALTAGLVTVAAGKVSNHTNLAIDTASNVAIGSTQITVDLGATAATANQYQDGFLCINDGTGVGQCIQIAGNSAAALSTACVVTLVEPLNIAITTSSKASLVYNPFANVIVHPGSSVSYQATGVPETNVAINGYYWSKVRGYASVLSDGIIAKGINAVLTSNAIAGALITQGSNTTLPAVGYAPEATVDTKYYPVFLTVNSD